MLKKSLDGAVGAAGYIAGDLSSATVNVEAVPVSVV